MTNPLGGITLTTYDAASNVSETTVESNNSTAAPNVVTTYTYDADNRVVSTTVDPGGGALAATTSQAYDPDGNVYCPCRPTPTRRQLRLPVPAVAAGVGHQPAEPVVALLGHAHVGPGQQRHHHASTTPTATSSRPPTPTCTPSVIGLRRRRAHLLQLGPDQRGRPGYGQPLGTYPYLCPSTPPRPGPAGLRPGVRDHDLRPGRATCCPRPTRSATPPVYTYAPAARCSPRPNPGGNVTTNCYYYEDGTGECAHGAPAGGGSADDLYSTTTPATGADPSGR